MTESMVLGTGLPKNGAQSLEMTANAKLNQFRADFALVHQLERLHGHANEDEAAQLRAQGGAAVKVRMGNKEWMQGASSHFAQMAEAMRRDIARSERIRAEERAAMEVAR